VTFYPLDSTLAPAVSREERDFRQLKRMTEWRDLLVDAVVEHHLEPSDESWDRVMAIVASMKGRIWMEKRGAA
jgi:hypothetical protein